MCFLVSLRLGQLLPYSHSPICPHETIFELKGGRAGQVVKCQVANPSWNEGRFTWSLLNRRECPRNEMFKKPLKKIQLTPALGSSECSWSMGVREESSSSIQKQSRVTTWWGFSLDGEKLLFHGGREAGRRHGLNIGVGLLNRLDAVHLHNRAFLSSISCLPFKASCDFFKSPATSLRDFEEGED